ncbi:hypothetical protein NAT51_15955 [Flavobacterium amniphilum]|uniref:hypothetical protein n=1 Tax=Flavobacterium amniphilum TaxID=1834035 RepID=UPI00202AB5EE|nr:hypothetical protein [Flavobacterium amniphilum]MCL9807029.1 hypothetical protein [Flavobacterium amniphilum]
MGNYTKEEVREIIHTKYIKPDFFNDIFGARTTYNEYEKIKSSKYRSKEQTHNKNIYRNKHVFIFFLVLAFLVLIYLFGTSDVTKPLSFDAKALFWGDFLAILFFSYQVFFARKKILIKIKTDSFVLKDGTEIFWNKILITGILITNGKHKSYFVILGLDNGDVIKINTDESEMTGEDFIRIIHLNQA